MAFVWNFEPARPDEAALNRMKQHFPKPTEPMPEAWFMGNEIRFYTNLVESPTELLDSGQLGEAIHEIAGGIVAFPEIEYVQVWKDWFLHLLPYALLHLHEYSRWESVLTSVLTAFISIYPHGVREEYQGFRDDVIFNLGNSVIPKTLSRDSDNPPQSERIKNPLFDDIWYFSGSDIEHIPGISEEFSLPMIFCLKYLSPSEIPDWVQSLTKMPSPQWRLAVITWWPVYQNLLTLAEQWPQDGKIFELQKDEIKLIDTFWVTNMRFESLDDLISLENRVTFNRALIQYLAFDLYQVWKANILSHQTHQYGDKSIPMNSWQHKLINTALRDFESSFFNKPPNP